MAHPITANWIRFKRISEKEYKIINLLHDEEIVTDAYTVWFARQLNGKRNPYLIDKSKSKEDVDLLLEKLEAENPCLPCCDAAGHPYRYGCAGHHPHRL